MAARALEPTSVLIAALRQNTPADADYRYDARFDFESIIYSIIHE